MPLSKRIAALARSRRSRVVTFRRHRPPMATHVLRRARAYRYVPARRLVGLNRRTAARRHPRVIGILPFSHEIADADEDPPPIRSCIHCLSISRPMPQNQCFSAWVYIFSRKKKHAHDLLTPGMPFEAAGGAPHLY